MKKKIYQGENKIPMVYVIHRKHPVSFENIKRKRVGNNCVGGVRKVFK